MKLAGVAVLQVPAGAVFNPFVTVYDSAAEKPVCFIQLVQAFKGLIIFLRINQCMGQGLGNTLVWAVTAYGLIKVVCLIDVKFNEQPHLKILETGVFAVDFQ